MQQPLRIRSASQVLRFGVALIWVACMLGVRLCALHADSAEAVRIGGRAYRSVRAIRHDTFNLALVLQPTMEAESITRVDLLVRATRGGGCRRFFWDGTGFRLERIDGEGQAVRITEGATPLFASLADGGELLLKQRPHWFEVVADGRRVLRVLAAPYGPGTVALGVGEGMPEVAQARYQRVETIAFADDFMRIEEEGENLGLWQPQNGAWQLYSVMEQVRANPDARIREGREPQSERSVNPFCLSGRADDGAVILTGYPFWDDYSVGVSVKSDGGEFGVVFGASDADNLWLATWQLESLGVSTLGLAPARQQDIAGGEPAHGCAQRRFLRSVQADRTAQ